MTITVGEAPNQGPDAVDDTNDTPFETAVEGNVLPNDVDPDGDALEAKLVSDPANGSVTLNADGSYSYTPNAGFSGVDTFEYCIDDGNGGEDVATVTITVGEAPNQGPDAADDKVETAYATAVDGDALVNDIDLDGDALTATLVSGPDNGDLVFNADGTYTYTPAAGFSGTDVFTYEVSDGQGGTDVAEVCITVAPKPNEGPDAVDDSVETDFQTSITGDVTVNDTDPDGDELTVTLIEPPASGDLVLNADGSFSFTPADGFSGELNFTYEISDGEGGTDVAQVWITVGEAPNQAPDAVDDSNSTPFETAVSGNVLPNDVDPDGDNLTAELVTGAANGEVILNPDGSYTYTPNDGFVGTDTFEYRIDDGEGGEDIAVVTIDVGEPEPEKVYSYDVVEPQGSDAGGDIQRVTTSFNETTSEFTFRTVIDGDTDGFTLAVNNGPNPKGNGDEVPLFYFDNSGDQPVITAYNYNGENNFSSFQDTPIASSLNADSPFSAVEVTTDAAGNTVFSFNLDATSIQEFSDGETWSGVSFQEQIGVWLHPMTGLETSYNADGFLESWDFESQGYFDTANQDADCEIISHGDADASDDSLAVNEEGSVYSNVLGNDSDPDGDELTVVAVNGDAGGIGEPIAGSNGGTFTIDANGQVVFDAGSDFDNLNDGESQITTITYTIDDGNGGTDTATVTVSVWGDTDTEPVVVQDQRLVVNGAYNNGEGREVTLDLSQSVVDSDGDNLTYKLNFANSFFIDGQDDERGGADAPGQFGWEVKSFDASTGQLTLQIFTEQGESWLYDGHQAAPDVFVQAAEAKRDGDIPQGSTYQPFSFSVCDEDGHEVETTFGLQVFDVDYNSPIALDLDGSGDIETTGEHTAKDSFRAEVGETVQFDIDADGVLDEIEWFSGGGDGILVDTSLIGPNGEIDGEALFGDQGGEFANGYEKLAQLDANADGQISGSELENLAVWVDDGDAVLEDGELQSLQDNNIESISSDFEVDGEGRMRSTATTTDGQEIVTEDVWFASKDQGDTTAELSFKDRLARLRDSLLGKDRDDG